MLIPKIWNSSSRNWRGKNHCWPKVWSRGEKLQNAGPNPKCLKAKIISQQKSKIAGGNHVSAPPNFEILGTRCFQKCFWWQWKFPWNWPELLMRNVQYIQEFQFRFFHSHTRLQYFPLLFFCPKNLACLFLSYFPKFRPIFHRDALQVMDRN